MSLIFFGCWGDYKYRVKEVLSSLYKYIKRNPDVTNVIVAGDNYYIDKDKKKTKKIYSW